MKALTLSLLIGLFPFSVLAETLKVDPTRYLNITGRIEGGSIIKAADKLLDIASKNSDKPIFIGINSPGGAVLPGIQFVTAMKAVQSRGIDINCFVTTLAASMAFQILAECDDRYVFENSVLLWHPIRISGSFPALTPKTLLVHYRELRNWEKTLVTSLRENLEISDTLFEYHYLNETLHLGSNLKEMAPEFITIIDDIEGVPFKFSLSSNGSAAEIEEIIHELTTLRR